MPMTDQGIQYDEDSLLAEAADWLVCLISGDATEDDAARLAAWRATTTAHEAAFRDIAGVRSYAFVASKTKKPPMISRRAALTGGVIAAVAVTTGISRPPL